MDTKQIIQTINDLIETPKHSKIRWYVEKQALDLIDKLETKQLILHGVSNTFKAQIQSDIEEAKRSLKRTKENIAYSFEDSTGWVEEMNLIKGEVQGLTKALNYF